MRFAKSRDFLNYAVERAARRAQGQLPSPILLSAAHSTDLGVADRTALPVIPSTVTLQNSSGKALFLVGYSAIGGPDVIG